MNWVLITYRLPSGDSTARVTVWREVRRCGALHLQQSVVAFPEHRAFTRVVERFRAVVEELGGETLAVRAEPLASGDGARLAHGWNEARTAEYAELSSECQKFLVEIDHEFEIEKFTLAELDEEEADLDKLERWHERIAGRDVLGAEAGDPARAALEQARGALERYSDAVFKRTGP